MRQKSFLKWPGNKRQLLESIIKLLPDGKRFIEPFVGSGVVFLNVDYPKKIVADSNSDLINLYQTLMKHGETFIEYAETFFNKENNTKHRYYAHRELFNSTEDPNLKSALFLYLNRHGYNGLCRYNKKGGYNVPFGKYKTVNFPLWEIREFRKLSQDVKIKCCDFRELFNKAKEGDVIYCDPPYVPLKENDRITQFTPTLFDDSDHISLAEYARKAAQNGIKVLISNHDTKFTRKIYKGAKIKKLQATRYISCKGDGRGKVKEIMAFFEE